MPEHDPTSPYAHLITLVQEYRELTALLESGLLETDDVLVVLGDRQVVHDHIIEELARLGQPTKSRQEALDIAERLVWWYRIDNEEG
jgi:hypothetical protein